MKIINPYLTFNGNCEEAFNHYKKVFGGELSAISRFEDMPEGEGMKVEEENKKKILHVSLPIGKETVLMGSDTPSKESPVTLGNNISVSVHPDSEKEAKRIFDGLAEGGIVTMPIAKAFWNAYFGMCTDKFGVSWMVNYDYSQEE